MSNGVVVNLVYDYKLPNGTWTAEVNVICQGYR